MDRSFERDESRRQYRIDDDPRDDPRERFGNEEDQWSREYRRAYAERDLPRRMHDDRPYDRPGYEPEFGRPGARENVDLERGDPYREYRERYARGQSGYDRDQPRGQRTPDERGSDAWQGGYYGQGRRWSGEPLGREVDRDRDPGRTRRPDRGRSGQPWPGQSSYGQPSYGRSSSPYDGGEISPWYGGDTGMGDAGSSQYGGSYERQYGARSGSQHGGQTDRGSEPQRLTPGRFSGRGPRGYRRSDERIREDVCEILTRHGDIDASEMEVEVRSATVILRGSVDSGRTRRLAEEAIEEIPGVLDVRNELRVSRRTGYDVHGYPQHSAGAMADTGVFATDRNSLQETGASSHGAGPAGTSDAGLPAIRHQTDTVVRGAASQANRWQVRETMDVVGSDGESVGTVKTVRDSDFLVDRPMARDLYVPLSAVRTVDGDRVLLGCRAAEVDGQHWPTPSLTGSSEAPSAR